MVQFLNPESEIAFEFRIIHTRKKWVTHFSDKNIKLRIVTDTKDRITHVDRENLWGYTAKVNI